jgi:16S rRNA processing protein RimM
LIGRVARPHGNRGEVIVNLETDFPEKRFAIGHEVLVGAALERRRIVSARFHQGRPVIALEGVKTMNDAEALAGAELKIPASAAAALPAGTFYRHDLVGCEVRDAEGRRIGQVTGVEGTLDRSLLAVATSRGEALIPLAAEICVSVDVGAKVVVIDPPEGLIELNERTSSSE